MFTGCATGSLRDWPAADPRRYQPSPGQTDRHGRLLLWSHGDEEQLGQLPDQILTIAPPTWRPKMLVGNDTYGITGIPSTVAGRGGRKVSGTSRRHKGIYPGSGRKDA